MDDQERQPAREGAQEAREKGAEMEYDAEDEDALAQSASPSDAKKTPQQEKQ